MGLQHSLRHIIIRDKGTITVTHIPGYLTLKIKILITIMSHARTLKLACDQLLTEQNYAA